MRQPDHCLGDGAIGVELRRPATNVRSTLSVSSGSRFRYPRADQPVPKSSIAMVTPRARSRRSVPMSASASSSIMLSVISSVSPPGPMPVCSRMVATLSSRWGSWTWAAERFTLIRKPSGRRSRSRHAASWRHASPSTHRPMGTMRPVSSATGTKWSGRRARGRGAASAPGLPRRLAPGLLSTSPVGSARTARRGRGPRAAQSGSPCAAPRLRAALDRTTPSGPGPVPPATDCGRGVEEQFLGGHRLTAVQRDADAGGDEDLLALHDERAGQRRADPLRHRDGFPPSSGTFVEHRELVAADTSGHVAVALDLGDAGRDRRQHPVALGVAQ